jgi:hypothetical protein
MEMDSLAVRRLIAGRRAAARRTLDAAPRLAPQQSFSQALDLWELCPELFDRPPDAVRLREEAATRAKWALLRRRLR